jgi:predicted phosphodiesterase
VDELRLHGISDIHLGSSDCDEEMFLAYLKEIEKDPAARVILNGDLLQYDTRGSKGDVYRQKYPPSQQKRLMREYLTPIKDKIIGMLGGNHDALRTQEDASPIQDIAEWLGVPYAAGEGLFKLPVGRRENKKPFVYTVYCTHGWSNSRAMGGKANNLQRLSDIVLADVYMISHTHTPMVFPDTYYVPDLRNNKVDKRIRYYVNTGSFQKRGMYPTTKGMRPVALLNPVILLSGVERRIDVKL